MSDEPAKSSTGIAAVKITFGGLAASCLASLVAGLALRRRSPGFAIALLIMACTLCLYVSPFAALIGLAAAS